MTNISNIILLTSCTLSSYYLFATSIKLHNDRFIKYPNKPLIWIDYMNLSIMVITGLSIINLTKKSFELLENT